MPVGNIVVSGIRSVYADRILPDRLYIPTIPRKVNVLAVITSGQIVNTCGNDVQTVEKNELLYLKPGSLDISRSAFGSEYITVEFPSLNDNFYIPRHTRFSTGGERVTEAYETMLRLWKSGRQDIKMKCFELLYGVLNRVSDELEKSSDRSYKYNRLCPAIEYINQHCLEKDFRVERLAELCDISGVHLNRLFRELFNVTVSAYVQDKRIETAKTLLLNSQNNIGEVAERCGWSSMYSFSHAFKRAAGAPPSEWRLKN